MGHSEAEQLSWISRQIAKLSPGRQEFIRHTFGEPYPSKVGSREIGTLLAWRLILIIPLLTIPTFIRISSQLPESYDIESATIGFHAWTGTAICYLVLLVFGTFLSRHQKLSYPASIFLILLCLVAEFTLTSFHAYLFGSGGAAYYSGGAFTVIILLNRVTINHRLGLISAAAACIACSCLVLANHIGAPLSPILHEAPPTVTTGIYDLVFGWLWFSLVFLGANVTSNQVHKLRVELEHAHGKLEKLNQFITESVLKRYLPPSLIQQILAGDIEVDKPAEMKTITILFSDLKDFTATSEKLGPQDISSILNEYFTAMNEVIFAHDGTIDKFIGDAIMVFFGAPKSLAHAEQASQAKACALAMQKRMKTLASTWQSKGASELSMRIGLHQGEAIVGNLGSNQRMDYTCIGPNVNLASRIESACQPGEVYISETVIQHLPESDYERVGEFNLKGIQDEQTLYKCI